MRLKSLAVLGLLPFVSSAQDLDQFCQTLAGPAEYCETAQAARIADQANESLNDDLSSIASVFSYDMPKEAILKYCQLAGAESAEARDANDKYCEKPEDFVCGENAGKFELDPKKVIDSLAAQQKKTSWLSMFYARESGAIVLAKPLGSMAPTSDDYKKQVFVGRDNSSNLITTFASEVMAEYSSTGDKSVGRDEIKSKIASQFGSHANLLSESSLASHQGFKDRLQKLSGNMEEALITPDEYLADLQPQPLPDSWKNEDGKGYFIKRYNQYINNCGTDGLKPKMFFSRYKDGTGQVQEKLVMCPGFILAEKNKPQGIGLEGEVIKALADYMTIPESSFPHDFKNMSDNPEGISAKEAELFDCYHFANSLKNCFPEPAANSACQNHASNNLSVNQKLSNELMDKVIAQKGIEADELKSWLGKNMKGSCGGTYTPAFSSKVRSVLKCETGSQFANACLANGAVDQSSTSPATELSCEHVCANGGCDGVAPRLVQRNTMDGHFGSASGLNGVAPIALGSGFRGGKMCAYNKNGGSAFQSPMPLGFKCKGYQVAGYCDHKSPEGCMKTWEASGQWSGVSCYDNNGHKELPERIDRNQLLSMQQIQLDQKCESANARYASISQRRALYSNKRDSGSTIGERVEEARESVQR